MATASSSDHHREKRRRLCAVLALATVFVVTDCAPYASVSSAHPRFRAHGSTIGALARSEWEIDDAIHREKREPLAAIGKLLAVAQTAQEQLAHNPANVSARDAYSFAVARVIGTIEQAKFDPWSRPLRITSTAGDFVLTHKPRADRQQDPVLYEFIPADQFRITRCD